MDAITRIRDYKSHKKRYLFILGFMFLLVAGLFILTPKKESVSHFTYITKEPKRGNLTMTVSATGYLNPSNTISLGTEVSGTISELLVDFNDPVKKGDVLAKINQTKYKSALLRARANLNAAKANLKMMQARLYRAEATVARNKKMRQSTKGSLPSPTQWDKDWATLLEAQAQVSSAKAQIEQAKQSLISARYDLDRTTIYAPIDGIILERTIEVGQTVAASFQTPVLFKISDNLKEMELQVSIDEADIGKLKVGQKAFFSVDAYADKRFEATVKSIRINSQTQNGVVTYKTILAVNNSKLLLKPGMSADVSIITQVLHNVLIVPRSALLYIPVKKREKKMFDFNHDTQNTKERSPHVWILKNKQPKKVAVTILGSNGTQTAVESKVLTTHSAVIIMQETHQ